MKNKESKFYTKWWFWTILAICALGVLSSINTENCNCSTTYEAEYKECILVTKSMTDNWDNYVIALHDYCIYDTSNLICISSQGVFEQYGW